MIIRVFFILALTILQNFLLINSASTAQKYIEVDKIVAIVETQTITNSELNKKKEEINQNILRYFITNSIKLKILNRRMIFNNSQVYCFFNYLKLN